tara:strand:- start:530 stop:778 length:249 start_codon:yes stop_codon:yes gene_type:complete
MNKKELIAEVSRLSEIVVGSQIAEEAEKEGRIVAEDYIKEIAELIFYEQPLKYQDRWLEVMMELGYYTPEPEAPDAPSEGSE